MRKSVIFAAVLPLALVACQTPGTVPPVSPIVGGVVGLLPDTVVEKIRQGCGFATSLQTAQALIAAFGGPVLPGIVNQIVEEVCGAVKQDVRMGRRRSSAILVRGVVVRGKFVR